jgi:nucleotide-binding universal stress UspA family protein
MKTRAGHAPREEQPAPRHILCPVNDTAVAQIAFQHAAEVAHAFGTRLTAVSVLDPGAEREAALTPQRLKEALHSWLPAGAETVRTDCWLQPVVRHGDPAEQVITLAREAAVDLIVIGAQHRRFVDSTVLGVTTVRVTRHASCPVLVVPRWTEK